MIFFCLQIELWINTIRVESDPLSFLEPTHMSQIVLF